jgi:hypothetical protein
MYIPVAVNIANSTRVLIRVRYCKMLDAVASGYSVTRGFWAVLTVDGRSGCDNSKVAAVFRRDFLLA